jgi:hypothetical protein
MGVVLDTTVDGQPIKYFGILSIAVEFEPRANAGDAPVHIEEEEESEEEEAEVAPLVAVEEKKAAASVAKPPAAASQPLAQPKAVEEEEAKVTVRSAVLTPTTTKKRPTGEVSVGSTLIKYAHIALVAAPLLAGLYQKYRGQGQAS